MKGLIAGLLLLFSIQTVGAQTLSTWITNACAQRQTIGNNDFGVGLENICNNFSKNTFEANLGAILGVMNNPNTGIGIRNLSRDRMRFIIMCGRGPSFPNMTSYGYNCTTNASALNATPTNVEGWYEWFVYQSLIKRFLVANTGEEKKLIDRHYIHMLEAQDIMRFKLASLVGCTGIAKTFIYLVRSVGIKAQYVATVDSEDYKATCNCVSSSCIGKTPVKSFSKGHQVVAVQMLNKMWRIVDSSSGQLRFANRYGYNMPIEVSSPGQLQKQFISFSNGTRSMVVAVEGTEYLDNLGLNQPGILENLYASGTRSNSTCQFNP